MSDPAYPINLKTDLFESTIRQLVEEHQIKAVVETGTFNGLGSTTVFAKTALNVYTVESCKPHFDEAVKNLSAYPNVQCFFGSSLKKDDMVKFISSDEIYQKDIVKFRNILVDGGENPQGFYTAEVTGYGSNPTEEDVLPKILDALKGDYKILVFLDSAGGVGYLEFQYVMSLPEEARKRIVLVLDDVSHVKHFRSVVWLNQNGYMPVVSADQRFAYCVL